MPQTVKKAVASGDAIRAFGPGHIAIAESRDGGRTWVPTKDGLALEEQRRSPVPRVFDRRIAAVIDAASPALERRIMTPFSILHETGTLAGWAPYAEIANLADGALDGIYVPGASATPEQMKNLRRVSRSIMLDLDSTTSLKGGEGEAVWALLPLADAVIVPSEVFAARLRPHHPHVFVVNDLLQPQLWRERTRTAAPRRPQVAIGAPLACPGTVEEALARIQEKHGERVRIVRYDWRTLFAADQPDHYLDLDLAILPAPDERHMASVAPLLPAMAAGCGIIADRLWPLIRHGTTGWQIGRDTAVAWTGVINMAVLDSRKRITMGRAASAQARRWTPELRRNQIFLPVRLVVPRSEPVVYR